MTFHGLLSPFNEAVVQASQTSKVGLVCASSLAPHPREGVPLVPLTWLLSLLLEPYPW